MKYQKRHQKLSYVKTTSELKNVESWAMQKETDILLLGGSNCYVSTTRIFLTAWHWLGGSYYLKGIKMVLTRFNISKDMI